MISFNIIISETINWKSEKNNIYIKINYTYTLYIHKEIEKK